MEKVAGVGEGGEDSGFWEMQILETIAEVRGALAGKERVVLVPTMGAIHAGHVALMEEARRLAGGEGIVVASVFVNPTQFGPKEDFKSYPRDLEGDAGACEAAGVDVVFAPPVGEMYAEDASVTVSEETLSMHLCGRSRPGHFAGVATVVLKLINIVRPDVAVFGKKDYQQLAIIRRLVRDLNLEVEIVGVETVREEDGLAMSSRNAYLTAEERAQAPVMRAALLSAAQAVKGGEVESKVLEEMVRERIAKDAPLGRVDYVNVVGGEDMQLVERVEGPTVMAMSVYFGKSRLIDNIEFDDGSGS
ncbi:MAG: pantoate--beta-alanine ligase [Verrucomicrobiota bacterium]